MAVLFGRPALARHGESGARARLTSRPYGRCVFVLQSALAAPKYAYARQSTFKVKCALCNIPGND